MKMLFKAAALASAVAMPALVALPVQAQLAAGQNTAVIDVQGAIAESAAYKAAAAQIQTTYKTSIDAYNARAQALQTELAPAQQELQTLQANAATPKATLDAKVAAFRTRTQAAQTELARLAVPFARPTAYAREQVEDKLEEAIKAAMTAKKVNLVINPEAILAINPGANLTPDVVTQLNTLVKTVSITPPAGWEPGQPRQAAAGTPAAAPAATAPGR
jgi:Skp family chaperone for outer membrane proteins